MDVTCPRCQTDYEFDDALVSERGTTVKCTNCGHQFRVFRPRASQAGTPTTASPELWRIDRREGEPLELRSLVELQRAIRAGRVSRTDLLRRGDGAARRVGDIPELEPFFPAARQEMQQHTLPLPAVGGLDGPMMPPGQRIPAHTPAYGKAQNPAQNAISQERSGSGTLRPPGPVPPPARHNEPSNPGAPRPRSGPPPRPNTTLRTPLGLAPYVPSPSANPPPPAHGPVAEPHAPAPDSVDPPTVPMAAMSASEAAARLQAADAAAVARVSAARATPLPPPRTPPPPVRPGSEPGNDRVSLTDLVAGLPGTEGAEPEPPTRRRVDSAVPTSTSTARIDTSPSQPSREELYESLFPPTERRRSRGSAKWIVALVIVGGLVLVGATVGRPYVDKALAMAGIGGAPSGSAGAARLQDAIAAGDRARGEGDYAVAREAYLRATVIDDKSLPAWDGFCSAESELAIVHWIAAMATGSSLERDQATSIGASAGRTCARWGELARASEEGVKKAEADLRPARALAAQGNGSGLRLYLPAHANEPILEAMVVLADATKGDAKTIETAAKTAAATLAKVPLGMFATPGDVAIAAYTAAIGGPPARLQEALDELAKRAPRHMLLDTLKQLGVNGSPAAATSASGSPSSSASVVASASAAPSTTGKVAVASTGTGTGTAPTATGGGGPDKPTGDYRDLDKKGHEALMAGDVTKAETMFRGALAQNPGDIDALFGLGQIERNRGNHAAAISNFKSVLEHSPGFSSARLMLADEQWATGAQGDAIPNYKLYLETVQTGSGADRARQRTGQTTEAPTPPPPAPTE